MQILEPQQFATWNEPVDMLYACHSKVKRFCKQLQILPDYVEKNGINQAVQNDVQIILNYFNIAAKLHHQDEEDDFFPALLKYAPQAQADVNELERQHEILHSNWDRLAQQLKDLLAKNRENIDRTLIADFVAGYDKHIALEEPLFELGKEFVPQAELTELGKIMFARRQG